MKLKGLLSFWAYFASIEVDSFYLSGVKICQGSILSVVYPGGDEYEDMIYGQISWISLNS